MSVAVGKGEAEVRGGRECSIRWEIEESRCVVGMECVCRGAFAYLVFQSNVSAYRPNPTIDRGDESRPALRCSVSFSSSWLKCQ